MAEQEPEMCLALLLPFCSHFSYKVNWKRVQERVMHHIWVTFTAQFSLWEWKIAQLYKEMGLTYETTWFLYKLSKALLQLVLLLLQIPWFRYNLRQQLFEMKLMSSIIVNEPFFLLKFSFFKLRITLSFPL